MSTSQLPDNRSSEPAGYRSISVLAVVGFALAVLISLGLVIAAGIAYFLQVPLVIDLGLLVLPVAAVLISLAARYQIVRSEGTRIGLRLTRWAISLSVLSALGYLAYHVAGQQALKQQSSQVADRWFELIQAGNKEPMASYAAFLETLPPSQRDVSQAIPKQLLDDSPDLKRKLNDYLKQQGRLALTDAGFLSILAEEPELRKALQEYLDQRHYWGKGKLARFLDNDLVKLLQRAGPDTVVELQSVNSWSYSGDAQGRFVVKLNYKLVTPEGEFLAVIRLQSDEYEDESGRSWLVFMPDTYLADMKYSPLGAWLKQQSDESWSFARRWLGHLRAGRKVNAFEWTVPPRQQRLLRYQKAVLLWGMTSAAGTGCIGSAPVLAGNCPAADPRVLPGYQQFLMGSLVNDAELKADEKLRTEVVAKARRLFQAKQIARTEIELRGEGDSVRSTLPSRWTTEPQALVFEHPVLFRLPDNRIGEGIVEVATDNPAAIKAVAGGPKPASVRWQVRRVVLRIGAIVRSRR